MVILRVLLYFSCRVSTIRNAVALDISLVMFAPDISHTAVLVGIAAL